MQKEGDSAMRPEYDFSQAVPSRHGERLSESERGELLQRATTQDAQTWMSFALHQVQELEALIMSYLVLAWEKPYESASRETVAILESRRRSLLTRLLADIRLGGTKKPDFPDRFRQIMAERSWLVHKGGLFMANELERSESLVPLVSRLERLVDETHEVRDELAANLEQRLSIRGFSHQEIQQRKMEVIQEWLAA
jgi:hypothetical protein